MCSLNLTPYFGLLYLLFGVTAVRDAGDVDGTALGAVREIGDEFAGPRAQSCGPFIGGEPPRVRVQRYQYFPECFRVSQWANTIVLHQPSDAAAAVDRLVAAGYECVKSYDDLTADQVCVLTACSSFISLNRSRRSKQLQPRRVCQCSATCLPSCPTR